MKAGRSLQEVLQELERQNQAKKGLYCTGAEHEAE